MLNKEHPFFGFTPKTYAIITSVLFFIASLIYCQFLLSVSQFHYGFEILIAIIFPLVGYRFFEKSDNWVDIRRLILLETGFNMICIAAKVSNSLGMDHGMVFSWMFVIFFIFQTGGFLISQTKKKKYKCLPCSIVMGIGLAYWFISTYPEKTIVTSNGEVQFWGSNAPVYLQIMYVFWVANVFLVEFRQYLPKATMYAAHAATVIIALASNEFFHARVLTASHFFILSAMIPYKFIEWKGHNFAVIPWLKVFKDDTHIVAITFPKIMNISCIAVLLYVLFIQ